jgi:L-ascorbate metabolism protein UlaG (beta-lactamase superfamily)
MQKVNSSVINKKTMPPSDHFNGKVFFNPTNAIPKHSFFAALRMWFTTPKAVWPKHVFNTATPRLDIPLTTNELALTFINHATFLIQINGLNIITDPVWAKRVSPIPLLGPKRVRKPGVAFKDLPKIDLILISHNHYDHLDVKTLKRLKRRFDPKVLVPLGDKELIESLGFKNVHEFDWWGSIEINKTTKISFLPTQHFSSRTLFDHSKSLWGSYIIESNSKSIYFGGDAGYSTHYLEIFKRFGAMDVALLGIGAYEPSWFMQHMHMNPAEAVRAHLDLQSKQSIGMHFGTFQLSAEAIDQPVIDLLQAKKQAEITDNSFIVMTEGETKLFSL